MLVQTQTPMAEFCLSAYYHLNIPVVFGGSINKDNINELLKNKNIDGFMICSSILNPDNITKIMTKIQLQ